MIFQVPEVPLGQDGRWTVQHARQESTGPPDVRIGTDLDAVKTCGRDANNRERNVVDGDPPADDTRVTPETSSPEPIAEHGRGDWSTQIIVSRNQHAAGRGAEVEDREEVA